MFEFNFPFSMDEVAATQSAYTPTAVNVDSNTYRYFRRSLTQRLAYLFEWKGLPDTWDEGFLFYQLAMCGFVCVMDSTGHTLKGGEYGVIPQPATLSGVGIYYQPTTLKVATPFVRFTGTIHEDCEIIKLCPDYAGIGDIIDYYATKLCYASKAFDMSMRNSLVAWAVAAKNRAAGNTIKAIIDRIQRGQPAVVFQGNWLKDDEQKEPWQYFTRDVKASYISTDVLNDMREVYNQFDTEIGIPNANVGKRERLNADEVNANNTETQARATVWLETLQKCVERVNAMYGLSISVEFRKGVYGDVSELQPEGAV